MQSTFSAVSAENPREPEEEEEEEEKGNDKNHNMMTAAGQVDERGRERKKEMGARCVGSVISFELSYCSRFQPRSNSEGKVA